jgi:TolB-like protein
MSATLLLIALTAAAGADVAVLPLSTLDVPAERGELYAEHLATRLIEHGLVVTTPRDIANVLGLERQRQLLGCDEGASCIAELAGALGVKELVSGQVARVDGSFRLVIKVLRADTGAVRFARSVVVDSEAQLFSTLDAWAASIAGRPPARNRWALLPVGLGVVTAGVGAGFLVSAGASYGALGRRGADALPLADAVTARDTGSTHQLVGAVLVGVGAVAVAAGLTWFLLSAPDDAHATWLVPTPAGLALVGVLP